MTRACQRGDPSWCFGPAAAARLSRERLLMAEIVGLLWISSLIDVITSGNRHCYFCVSFVVQIILEGAKD